LNPLKNSALNPRNWKSFPDTLNHSQISQSILPIKLHLIPLIPNNLITISSTNPISDRIVLHSIVLDYDLSNPEEIAKEKEEQGYINGMRHIIRVTPQAEKPFFK